MVLIMSIGYLGGLRFHRKLTGGVCGFTVENYSESHKPVEIDDLGPCGAWVGAGYTESPTRRSKAVTGC